MPKFFSRFLATIRNLARSPSYFLVSTGVLGVSVAAQLVIFAMVQALLFEPPSARRPSELVFIRSSLDGGVVSYPDFVDVAARAKSFTGVFGYYISSRASMMVGDDFRATRCAFVTGSYFPTLDAPAAQGRLIEANDDKENAPPVAVISEQVSRQQNLTLGSMIRINTFPFTVVGILPASYRGIERTTSVDVWIPASQLAAITPKWVLTNRGSQSTKLGARLAPGASLASANAELAVIAQQLQRENPDKNYGMTLRASSFAGTRYNLDSTARMTVLLSALVWLLFALSLTNFFALTLLRLLNRERDSAVRIALGATRTDLALTLLQEQFLIGVAALALGWTVASGAVAFLRYEPRVARLMDNAGIALDFSVLEVVALSVGLCALVVWVLSARQSGRYDLLGAIKAGPTAPRRKRSFSALFAIQFALSLMLAATAISLLASLRQLASPTHPFRTENLLLFDVGFRNIGVSNEDRVVTAEKFLARLRTLPGLEAVGAASFSPLGGMGSTNLIVNERNPSLEPDQGLAGMAVITGDYFSAAGFRMLQGRSIETREVNSGARVMVVNSALARRYWPGADPIGKTLRPWDGGALYTIVGVVADTPVDSSLKVLPQIYFPWGQMSTTNLVFHVAVKQDGLATRQAIQQTLAGVWPYKTFPPIRSIRDQIGDASADLALSVRVVVWVAGLATLVTACGLYFFSAYTAAQTLKDSAIRQALGAERRHLVAAHLSRYYGALAVGSALGVALLYGAQPVLQRLGVPVAPLKLSYIAIGLTLIGVVAAIGLFLPLRRVLRVDVLRVLNNGP